jgi:hypothetical protein
MPISRAGSINGDRCSCAGAVLVGGVFHFKRERNVACWHFSDVSGQADECRLNEVRRTSPLRAPKSKIQFNGVSGLLTYISFTQGADDTSDRDNG